jgi:hypothetical protein
MPIFTASLNAVAAFNNSTDAVFRAIHIGFYAAAG